MKFRNLRVILCLHFAFLYVNLLFSQEIRITASNPDYNFGTTNLHKIIGHDSSHFYVIQFHGSQYFVQKLDEDLNLLLEEPLKLFEGLKTYELETIIHFHNQLYIFVSRQRFNDIILYYQKIDKSNLHPSTDWIEISRTRFIKGNWPDYHFALSRTEKILMVALRTKLELSKIQFNEYFVFGDNMELIWKQKDSFSFVGLGPRDNHYVVDEYGNISILSLQKRESIFSLFSDKRNIYNIYRYTNSGADYKEYEITLGKDYIRGIRIIGGSNGELIGAGLYSELYHGGMRGSFFFKIHPTNGQISDYYLNKYDNAFLSHLIAMKEPTLDKKEELIEYVVTDLVLRSNDKVMLLAEQFFYQTYDTYNNIIITCFDTTGRVYWNRVVDKNQDFNFSNYRKVEPSDYRDYVIETGALDSLDNYCSYAMMAPLNKTSIILFFNDNIKNLDQPEKRKNFNRPRKSYLLAVTIDEFGNISKQPVLKREKKTQYPEPIRYYDTLYNCIVIPASRNRKYNYYKIVADFE
jgi:hypothetical protein